MVSRIYRIIALVVLAAFVFGTDTPKMQAADCAMFGYAQISSDKLTVPKGSSATIKATYRWGVSPAPASCYDQPVAAYFSIGGAAIGDRINVGVVQKGGDSIIEKQFDQSDLPDSSATTVRVEVEFFIPPSSGAKQILATTYINLNFENSTTTYACVAADSKYACSPDGTLKGCQDTGACQSSKNPKAGCTLLADKDKCGQFASTTSTNPSSSTGSTGSGGQGKSVSYSFRLTNPLKADDFMGLISSISTWIFNLSIPVAVIVIVWAGLRFLWARGNPAEVGKAKEMLKYAVIGLVIIFIGRGFITLIQSIINLGAK